MGFVAPRHVGSSGPEIELGSPALAGRFFTTEPSGKTPLCTFLNYCCCCCCFPTELYELFI